MAAKLITLSLLILSLAGCKSKSKSAFNYSQDIVALERALEPDIEATEDKVGRYFENNHYDSIVIAATSMENKVQEKIDKVSAMPVPDAKGVKEFKKSILDYFGFIKSLYTSYKNWGNAADTERESAMKKIMDLVEEKDKVIGEMQQAQRKYADANDFRLEK